MVLFDDSRSYEVTMIDVTALASTVYLVSYIRESTVEAQLRESELIFFYVHVCVVCCSCFLCNAIDSASRKKYSFKGTSAALQIKRK